jgi:anti-sigma-K factor RskA
MAHPTPDDLALVALGEDVDGAAIQHVAECRACFAEIEALQQVVAVGRSLTDDDRLVSPHPRVWQRVALEVDGGGVLPLSGAVGLLDPPALTPSPRDRPAAYEAVPERFAGRRPAPRRRRATVALAVAAALVVGLGGGFFLKGVLDPGTDVVGVTPLNALPSWSGVDGTASVEQSPDGARTLVVSMDLPSALTVDGHLEVWMSDTGASDMLPMGAMTGTSARFPIPATVDLRSHPIVDVSLEPPGDADPGHSDTSVLRGRLNV